MGMTSFTTVQSLGEIEQCTPAVGAKMWCLYVCLSRSEASALFLQGRYTLSRFCVAVYGSVLMPFSAFLQKGFPFQMG